MRQGRQAGGAGRQAARCTCMWRKVAERRAAEELAAVVHGSIGQCCGVTLLRPGMLPVSGPTCMKMKLLKSTAPVILNSSSVNFSCFSCMWSFRW